MIVSIAPAADLVGYNREQRVHKRVLQELSAGRRCNTLALHPYDWEELLDTLEYRGSTRHQVRIEGEEIKFVWGLYGILFHVYVDTSLKQGEQVGIYFVEPGRDADMVGCT
jgi:hypothetical protein